MLLVFYFVFYFERHNNIKQMSKGSTWHRIDGWLSFCLKQYLMIFATTTIISSPHIVDLRIHFDFSLWQMGMIQQSTNWGDCWVVRCLRRRSGHMNSSWLVFAEWRMICPTWWRTMQEAKQMNLNEAPIMSIFRLTNGGLIAIKMNLHSPNSQLRRIQSWRPLCNKICMVEMVQFCIK